MPLGLIIAHAGHWALWVLYAVPIVVVLASVATAVVRERRGDGEGEEPPGNG